MCISCLLSCTGRRGIFLSIIIFTTTYKYIFIFHYLTLARYGLGWIKLDICQSHYTLYYILYYVSWDGMWKVIIIMFMKMHVFFGHHSIQLDLVTGGAKGWCFICTIEYLIQIYIFFLFFSVWGSHTPNAPLGDGVVRVF